MSEAGRSAQARSESLRDRRRQRLRRHWPLVVVGVVGAFAFGYFLPTWIMIAAASFLDAVAPNSPGIEEPSFLPIASLVVGTLMAGAAALGLVRPSRSEVAWRAGASGERRVGQMLDRMERKGILVLHDRTIPGSRANIDHIAVTPGGVFTIESKAYSGRLEVRSQRSQLWVNRRDRSNLLDQARRQASAVSGVLAAARLSIVPVTPVLCFVHTNLPWLMPKLVGGVMVCSPRTLRRRLVSQLSGELSPDQAAAVAERLAAMFRPAG